MVGRLTVVAPRGLGSAHNFCEALQIFKKNSKAFHLKKTIAEMIFFYRRLKVIYAIDFTPNCIAESDNSSFNQTNILLKMHCSGTLSHCVNKALFSNF